MAIMWEGYCAFAAVCPVIALISDVSYPTSDTSFSDVSSIVWFWGLADYLHVRFPLGFQSTH